MSFSNRMVLVLYLLINEHELVKIKNNYVVGIVFIPFLHCKKRLAIFPSTAKMSLTKLSLAE
jgi:hypothetical protein